MLNYSSTSRILDWPIRSPGPSLTYCHLVQGLFGIPFVGFLLDKLSNCDAILVLALFGVVFGALSVTSTIAPQIISIATLTILRPLMYTTVSDFSAK